MKSVGKCWEACQDGLRGMAIFEAAKGALVLVVGCGLLAAMHHDVQAWAEEIVRGFHLNPARHYPRVFVHFATAPTDWQLSAMAAGAFSYAVVRFIEAWGLWRERSWAEWFAVLSGGLYLPVELLELFHRRSVAVVFVFVLNLLVVAWLGRRLTQKKRSE